MKKTTFKVREILNPSKKVSWEQGKCLGYILLEDDQQEIQRGTRTDCIVTDIHKNN